MAGPKRVSAKGGPMEGKLLDVKKDWSSPELTVYGTIDRITGDCTLKKFGATDGFTFQGTPITCAS
jgi:hypothetical protein